jgi:addiction module RelE/StbE family toxin
MLKSGYVRKSMPDYEVVLLPEAFSDLDEIFDYIAVENAPAAHVVLDKLIRSLSLLRRHPHSGPPLRERSLGRLHFRMMVVSPYIAFYRVVEKRVIVYRVLHGARNYPHLLRDAIGEDES